MTKLITLIIFALFISTLTVNSIQNPVMTPNTQVKGITKTTETQEVKALFDSCWNGSDFDGSYCNHSDNYQVFEDGSFLKK